MGREIVRRYSNDEITVVWKPSLCIHSRRCFRGLPAVFDPRRRPWIEIAADSSERILAQVARCPSGALSSIVKSEAEETVTTEIDARIEVVENGPLLVYGNLSVKNAAGEETKRSRVTAFCRCGQSGNKPFCDGSHITSGFEG
ncbi:MAG: (4Fe-4S)-binding protein [Thermoanaerobaculia bacterium]